MTLRSYHGCSRCKRRRQKCNEAKPSCGRCIQAGVDCQYSIILKWDGRVPRAKPETSRRKTKTLKQVESSSTKASKITENKKDEQSISLFQLQAIDPLDSLPAKGKLLLHHYMTKASLIASHDHIRNQICHQIIPMALQTPSLLYATMALSGIHRMALLNGVPEGFVPEAEVADFMSLSLQHLRRELQSKNATATYPLLHTIRTLCVCEIYSGKADASWRVHVDGARAIFELASRMARARAIGEDDGDSISGLDNWLTSRWYFSVEALTALTYRGLSRGQVEMKYDSQLGPRALLHPTNHIDEDCYLDIYTGYSSGLNEAFKEIGAAAWERQRLESANRLSSSSTPAYSDDSNTMADETTPTDMVDKISPHMNLSTTLSEADLQKEASWLEQSVLSMIHRDQEQGLKIPPDIPLTIEEIRQFKACNQAYQYTALIHIYRRVRKLESDSNEVQQCVREIINAVTSILPVAELSPWALLTTPIFTAGCEAIGLDRIIIKQLLQQLYQTLRIRNTSRAISILENGWNQSTNTPNRDGNPQMPFGDDSDILDFIPY